LIDRAGSGGTPAANGETDKDIGKAEAGTGILAIEENEDITIADEEKD
jgi:hypothetical protein